MDEGLGSALVAPVVVSDVSLSSEPMRPCTSLSSASTGTGSMAQVDGGSDV
eukprot:CAMPEP_0197058640 /NCGR_PEP_ID=MMETSP1384-20130603/109870_1 /TAXON_ID=29189 /ORGANISM="Ammonia sp." /LENGTH=50 /DNA_ID=CAMNT_0042493465 /DNA_START=19 /DNA_END=171 /DNA_ORIENTATION=-